MDWKKIIQKIGGQGLTQKEISEFCGCGQSTISDLLSGETREPRASLAFKLLDLSKDPS